MWGSTTVSPTTDHTTTTTKGVDANGNEITKKDSYREGIAGSSESHKTTATEPAGGGTTTTGVAPALGRSGRTCGGIAGAGAVGIACVSGSTAGTGVPQRAQ